MRKVFVSIAGMAMAVLMLLPSSAAADRVLLVSQQITIHATVLPARFIVLDPQGRIVQIVSNTAEAVTPRAYVGSIAAGNETAIDSAVQQQYEAVLAAAKYKTGILYQATPAQLAVARHGSKFTVFSWLNLRPALFHL